MNPQHTAGAMECPQARPGGFVDSRVEVQLLACMGHNMFPRKKEPTPWRFGHAGRSSGRSGRSIVGELATVAS